jgi:hypothetical protein
MRAAFFRATLRALAASLLLAVAAGAAAAAATGSGATFPSVLDHARTGFPLTGSHAVVACEDCHIRGVFKGTPNQCAGCHVAGARIAAVTPPANHIPTIQACDTCHDTSRFFAVLFSHVAVTPGTCATCHNGFAATGKPADHPLTAVSCDSCHVTQSFAAGVALKPSNHLPTTQQCGLCHANAAAIPPQFRPGIMNHAGITSGCAGCHATAVAASFFGVTITSPPPTHLPIAAAPCESCHAATNFGTFGGTPMNHAAVTGIVCSTCHETGRSFFGVTMVTRPTAAQDPAHPPTGECSTCHASTVSFTAGITALPANHIPTAAPCAQCHTGGTFAMTISNAAIHIGIASGCTSCHAAGPAPRMFLNVAPRAQVAAHIPTSSSCEICHANALPAAITFAGAVMNHAGIASGCAACHENGDANAFFGVTLITRPTLAQDPNHPQTGDCSACHNTAAFLPAVAARQRRATGTGTPATAPALAPAMAPNVHAGVPPASCARCHDGRAATGRPPLHPMVALACDACHRTTAWLPALFSHAGAAAACGSCHNGLQARGKPAGHMVTMRECALCHARTVAWQPVRYQHLAASASLAVGGERCETCHVTRNETVPRHISAGRPARP